MALDFAALPPEINSTRMYAGAGAGPMMAAATAWNNLAAELSTTASSWESIVSRLTGEQWTGAGSAAAAAAAQPYVSWLSSTAAAAQQAAAQATASAAAYEAAFMATVPPEVVTANRTLLASLVATNVLGINMPAIMAAEAHYAEMWVQDATAMYTYAASSAVAGTLQPLLPATQTTTAGGAAGQAAAVSQAAASSPIQGLGSVITGLQNALSSLANPTALGSSLWGLLPSDVQDLGTALDGFLGTPLIFNGVQQVGVTAAWFVGTTIPTAVSLAHTLAAAAPAAAVSDVAGAAGAATVGETALANAVAPTGLGGALTAGLGEATSVGGLSVPTSWSAATPATLAAATAPLEGSGWTVPNEAGPVAGIPGAPGMAAAAKGAGAYAGPRYGFKPIVMPKQVVV